METALAPTPFPLAGSAVHLPPTGEVALWQGDAIKARLRRRPDGHVLGAFPIACAADLHSQTWERHPEGDEILVMLSGALRVALEKPVP